MADRRATFISRLVLLLASAMAVAGPSSAWAQDAAAGATVFKRCSICHSTVPGKGSAIGPHMAGVVGRKVGTVLNYRYSKAMLSATFEWDAGKLDAFLQRPQAVTPGTKMAFTGLPQEKDRKDLIAYLATLN